MQHAQFLRRKQASEYLKAKYGFGSERTLAKLACLGAAPSFAKPDRWCSMSPQSSTNGRSLRLEIHNIRRLMLRLRDGESSPTQSLGDDQPYAVAGRAWERVSNRCPEKAGRTDFGKLWAEFNREYQGRKITLGWLRAQAQAHGWRAPRSWDRSTKIES
ncbi:MAG: hypothetical protein ACREDH_06435 [Methylocella sp.]